MRVAVGGKPHCTLAWVDLHCESAGEEGDPPCGSVGGCPYYGSVVWDIHCGLAKKGGIPSAGLRENEGSSLRVGGMGSPMRVDGAGGSLA